MKKTVWLVYREELKKRKTQNDIKVKKYVVAFDYKGEKPIMISDNYKQGIYLKSKKDAEDLAELLNARIDGFMVEEKEIK